MRKSSGGGISSEQAIRNLIEPQTRSSPSYIFIAKNLTIAVKNYSVKEVASMLGCREEYIRRLMLVSTYMTREELEMMDRKELTYTKAVGIARERRRKLDDTPRTSTAATT